MSQIRIFSTEAEVGSRLAKRHDEIDFRIDFVLLEVGVFRDVIHRVVTAQRFVHRAAAIWHFLSLELVHGFVHSVAVVVDIGCITQIISRPRLALHLFLKRNTALDRRLVSHLLQASEFSIDF